jgi:hypothetical protein
MSSFKKMKLIENEDSEKDKTTEDILNAIRLTTPVNLKQISDLDLEIKKILDKKLDDYQKAKLFSQVLRRYLTFKRKHEAEQVQDESLSPKKVVVPKLRRKIRRKKIKLPSGTIRTKKRTITPKIKLHKSIRSEILKAPKKKKRTRTIDYAIETPPTPRSPTSSEYYVDPETISTSTLSKQQPGKFTFDFTQLEPSTSTVYQPKALSNLKTERKLKRKKYYLSPTSDIMKNISLERSPWEQL